MICRSCRKSLGTGHVVDRGTTKVGKHYEVRIQGCPRCQKITQKRYLVADPREVQEVGRWMAELELEGLVEER